MAQALYHVTAIGNALVDIIAEADDSFLKANGIAKGTMTLIDTARAETLLAAVGKVLGVSGGSAGNTVAGVASLGGRAAFMGKVNDDKLGAMYRQDMQSLGVRFATASAGRTGTPTGRCIVVVTPDAERSMSTYLGAAVELGPDDIDGDTLRQSVVTYLEGYLFDPSLAKKAFRHAAEIVRGADRKLALTLSDLFCVERHRAEFIDFIRSDVDILFANEHELKALYQTKDLQQAIAATREDCDISITTRSAQGAVIAAGNELIEVAAVAVDKVVDSTGAGDLYAAGFLYGLTHQKSLAEAGHIGALAAAEVIGHYGPRPQKKLKELLAG